jgi:hypothetical protein
MKKVSLFAALIFMSISFMGNYVNSHRVNDKSKSQCPYLNKMYESSGSMVCPYLENKSPENSVGECPYLNDTESSSSNECPYLKKHGKAAKISDSYTPPIELIGT